MRVVFFPTKEEAAALEAKLYVQALANGQKCDRWAEIIVSKEGFGVPVKDRVEPCMAVAEKTLIVQWEAPAVAK